MNEILRYLQQFYHDNKISVISVDGKVTANGKTLCWLHAQWKKVLRNIS